MIGCRMKGSILAIVAVLAFASFSSCATFGGGDRGRLSLGDAVEQTAEVIAKDIPERTRMAIVAFETGSDGLSEPEPEPVLRFNHNMFFRDTVEPGLDYLISGEDWGAAFTLGFHTSLGLPFFFFGAEGRVGGVFYAHNGNVYIWGNFSPIVGALLPIGIGNIHAGFLFEMGSFGPWNGAIASRLAPGWGVGANFFLDDYIVLNLRYRGTWLQNRYVNIFGFAFGLWWL